MIVKAKNIKISQRKMTLIVNLVKGLNLNEAKAQLKYLNKRSAIFAYELLKSGAAAAKEKDLNLTNLYIKNFTCNTGPALIRRRICERGKATDIKKRMCHLDLTLSEKLVDNKPAKVSKNNKPSSTTPVVARPGRTLRGKALTRKNNGTKS